MYIVYVPSCVSFPHRATTTFLLCTSQVRVCLHTARRTFLCQYIDITASMSVRKKYGWVLNHRSSPSPWNSMLPKACVDVCLKSCFPPVTVCFCYFLSPTLLFSCPNSSHICVFGLQRVADSEKPWCGLHLALMYTRWEAYQDFHTFTSRMHQVACNSFAVICWAEGYSHKSSKWVESGSVSQGEWLNHSTHPYATRILQFTRTDLHSQGELLERSWII